MQEIAKESGKSGLSRVKWRIDARVARGVQKIVQSFLVLYIWAVSSVVAEMEGYVFFVWLGLGYTRL